MNPDWVWSTAKEQELDFETLVIKLSASDSASTAHVFPALKLITAEKHQPAQLIIGRRIPSASWCCFIPSNLVELGMHVPGNARNGQLTPVLEEHESQAVIPVPQQHSLAACHGRISSCLGCSKWEICVCTGTC